MKMTLPRPVSASREGGLAVNVIDLYEIVPYRMTAAFKKSKTPPA
jgi:hypothetical protein